MPKNIRSKAEIEAEVKVHVEAEKKAHYVVEHFALEEKVSENEFNNALNLIMVNHYQDITEERSISHLCGYPICAEKLAKRKKQKYHISLSQKKVFDVTERQFFCSDFCFKASKSVESQISTAPLWLRSEKQDFRFLKNCENVAVNKSEPGDHESLSEKPASYERFDDFDKGQKQRFPTKAITNKKQIKRLEEKDKQVTVSLNKLQANLLQWFEGYKVDKASFSGNMPAKHSNQLKDSNFTDDFHIKAMNFLSKNADWAEEAQLSEDFKQKMKIKSGEQQESYMPPIDSKSQGLLRKKIVKEKICLSLDKLQSITGWNGSDYVRWGLLSFLEKLNYTRENINLKPKEWIVMAICIMKIHALNHEDLSQCLEENVDGLDNFLKEDGYANMLQIETLCDTVLEEVLPEDNKDECDITEDSDDEFFDGIFPSQCGAGDLSTFAEYGEFEELD